MKHRKDRAIQHKITAGAHVRPHGDPAYVIWLTGLSGSGKSTIATALKRELFSQGTHACILDGVVSSGNKDGYKFFAGGFTAAGGLTNTSFVASSAPQVFNSGGVRLFCIATDGGTLRSKPGAPAVPPAPDVPTCIAYAPL